MPALSGKRILNTREASQAKGFTELIQAHGGQAIEAPLIKITCNKEMDKKIGKLAHYEWVFITSANGVHCFFKQINIEKRLSCKFAIVGAKTAEALASYGYEADFIPSTFNAETMANEFIANYPNRENILLVRGNQSRDILPNQFKKHHISFDMIEVYKTTINDEMEGELNDLFTKSRIDIITFMSPSTINAFQTLLKKDIYEEIRETHLSVCIGTTTARYAKKAGFQNIIIPEIFTIEGMIDCMVTYLSRKG